MRFGTYHVFQCPPWMTQEQVFSEELERVDLSEALGYDSVWVPEQALLPVLPLWRRARDGGAHHGPHAARADRYLRS
jgi:hypothetical protein